MPRFIPELHSHEWLTQKYIVEGLTQEEIAEIVGCSSGSVCRALEREKVPSRNPAESRSLRGTQRKKLFPLLNDEAWLREQYVNQNRTIEEISREIGCTTAPVLKALVAFSIERRRAGFTRPGVRRKDAIPKLRDTDWLREQYIDAGRSPADIAEEIGCTGWTVQSALSRWKIARHPSKGIKKHTDLPKGVRRKGGYIFLHRPDHPAATISGYVAEHRLVAEAELGRYLSSEEVVHHVNEKKEDNRPQNLIVFPRHTEHMAFHHDPPAWVPRCECCGKPRPEILPGRPDDAPLLWPTFSEQYLKDTNDDNDRTY